MCLCVCVCVFNKHSEPYHGQDDDEVDSSTMVRYSSGDSGTLRPLPSDGTLRAPVDDGGTLRALGGGTGTLSTDLGTMVINSDNEEEDEDSTMKSEWEKQKTQENEGSCKRPLVLLVAVPV